MPVVSSKSRRPNLIVVLADDLGAWALGCEGNQEVITPHLDRLAREGIRFTNFFCASPVCSPARASILTGKMPSAHGVWDWLRAGSVDREALPAHLRNHPYFQDDQVAVQYLEGQQTYTQVMAEAGYDVALCGKWHLGDSLHPQCGFNDYWFTIARGGTQYMAPDVVEAGQVEIREGTYLTDLITEKALSYLSEKTPDSNPFYLAVHYTAPHSPWDEANHPQEVLDLYRDTVFEQVPHLPPHPDQVPSAPQPSETTSREDLLRGYYAAITAMDRGIGRLMDWAWAQPEPPLFLFLSDNGMNMGHHGIWGKGNGTFPANLYDTSVRVPCLLAWPGHFEAGCTLEGLYSQYDIAPTLLELLDLPKDMLTAYCPGRSFAEACQRGRDLTDFETEQRVVVYDEYGPSRMIRSLEDKLIVRTPYGPDAYYDLILDPEETVNRIDEPSYQERILLLRQQLSAWFAEHTDPALDGTKEAVKGFGQYDRGGHAASRWPRHGEIPEVFHKI